MNIKIEFKKIAIILMAILLNTSALTYENGDDIETRYGTLRAGFNKNSQLSDHLIWNGKPILKGSHERLYIKEIYKMKGSDVILVQKHNGGMSVLSDYVILIANEKRELKIIEDEELENLRSDVDIEKSGNKITIHLGPKGGKNRVAILEGEKITIKSNQSNKEAKLSNIECEHIYSILQDCTKETEACSSGTNALPNSSTSWLRYAEDMNGFNSRKYNEACKNACTQKQTITLDKFKQEYCK